MFCKLFEVRHRHGLRYGRSPGRGWIATAAQRRDLRPESAALQRLQGNSRLQLTGDASADQTAEIARWQQQNERLRMEREILKVEPDLF